jgi:hypothetical protein
MNRRNVRRITLWLIVILVILGCATPALVTPPPSASGPGVVETIIVQTAMAAQTQTAIRLPPSATPSLIPSPTKTSTVTPTPTATILFLFATNTSVPAATSPFTGGGGSNTGAGSGTGGGGSGSGFVKPTATPQEWTCRVLSKSPANNTVLVAGTSFKATWTVQNTGTKTWPKQGVDVVYQSGARLNAGKPYYDIPAGVGPGGTVTISVTMEVPKRPKEYSTRWSLMVGRTQFCSVQFVFEAK